MHARFNPKTLTVAGLLLVLSGCASVVVPNEQIELTRSAVNRAVSADATQYAPVEMRSAQDNLRAMERALGEKKFKEVRILAERAESDARLAETKARASRTQDQLKVAREGIQVLRKELLEDPILKSAH